MNNFASESVQRLCIEHNLLRLRCALRILVRDEAPTALHRDAEKVEERGANRSGGHALRLAASVSRPSVEIIWNVVLVAAMLHLSRRAVAPAVVLTMYVVLWTLARLAHASLRVAVPVS